MRFVIATTALVTALGLGAPVAASQDPPPPPPPPTVAPPQSEPGAVSRDSAVPRAERAAPAPTPARAAAEGGNARRESATRSPGPAVTSPAVANSDDQGAERRGAVRRPPSSSPSDGRSGGGQGAGTRDRAVVRTDPPYRGDYYRGDGGPSRVYYYPDYWSYGRYYDPYYYGGFHLGYLAYSPWGWTPAFYGYPYGYGYGYGGGVYQASGYDIGSVKLKVQPRDAEVYVDGYFAGQVDEFDGVFQALRLDSGGYRIEIRKPGYETLQFDVRIQPERTITFRGELKAAP
jgi:PEGA domain